MSVIKLHMCNICGKTAKWSDTWQWYGSLLDEEESTYTASCSEACRQKFSTNPSAYHPYAKHSRNPLIPPKRRNKTPMRIEP